MRGRKPKPSALKAREGNPGKRAPNAREPALPPAPPGAPPPAELDGDDDAREEWSRLYPILTGSKVLTAGDRGSLIALCQQWSVYLGASAEVEVRGMVVEVPTTGYQMQNPYLAIANKALQMCVKLWAELGLTPSSRSRVSTSGEGEKDAFSKFDGPRQRPRLAYSK